MVYILLFIGAVAAFWLSSICGGGASLIIIPLLNTVLFSSIVPFSLTVGTFSSSASRIAVFYKHINWRIFYWFVPFSIPAVIIGAWLLKYINPIYLQLLVALLLISNLGQLLKIKNNSIAINEKSYGVYTIAIVGFLAGFVSGITGAIGLLFNRFYLNNNLTKEEIVATRAANEIFLHAIKLIIYLLLGLYSTTAIWLGLIIAIASVVASFTVKYILKYISDFSFKTIGYGAMVLSGVALLITASNQIIKQDRIQLYTTNTDEKDETTIKWRQSSFVLEYAWDEGLEVERPITYAELPVTLQAKYDSLMLTSDTIYLERVFKLGEENSYEFYCYKKGALFKQEF